VKVVTAVVSEEEEGDAHLGGGGERERRSDGINRMPGHVSARPEHADRDGG